VHRQLNVGFGGAIGLRAEGCAAKLAWFPELNRRAVVIGLDVIETAFLGDQARRREAEERGRKGGAAGGGRGKRRG
jgi:hypothetical protein